MRQPPNKCPILIKGCENTPEEWWCCITKSGDFEYGGSYTPSVAAKVFWDCVEKHIKDLDSAIDVPDQSSKQTDS